MTDDIFEEERLARDLELAADTAAKMTPEFRNAKKRIFKELLKAAKAKITNRAKKKEPADPFGLGLDKPKKKRMSAPKTGVTFHRSTSEPNLLED